MQAFAALLDALVYTRSRHAKLRLIGDYLRTTPDPDRGWALAALTGGLDLKMVQPRLLRDLMTARVDPVLFALSYDFVGDMAETVSLLWPDPPVAAPPPSLADVVDTLASVSRAAAPGVVAGLLDRLDAPGRYALIKLATGSMRVGASARLAKTAFAESFGVDVGEVEEIWHGLVPPYDRLFAWATGAGARPDSGGAPVFRPFMLAQPLEGETIDLADFVAEWKWDGIRVQVVHVPVAAGGDGRTRLYSRTGDDITGSFPDVAGAFAAHAALDGELLVRGEAQGRDQHGGAAASFNALQQRLGRKAPPAKLMTEAPAFVRLYDALVIGDEDLRALPWHARRVRLDDLVATLDPSRFDLSAIVEARDFAALSAVRDAARDDAIEGLMLKRRDSAYVAGRRAGLWYKWKRDPLTADCVLMYAQRGHGKRSSLYSDFTFGCWGAPGELLPVGKAYFGFTDAELAMLDKWVRSHTIGRFGPVIEVEKSLVVEIAFDSIHVSKRHKSGLAMRFPRIARIRTDKPAAEADTVAALARLV
ncbi:cisplatin damage response ATP-dependent DNA ligase [Polymorphobacter fuscus]|uniref:DNA ligase (ATP) n=1 Tax=Sandarakinorhabdus fusca TaxID=1439888 RepID=A0A7C9KJJ3_9SPHN|nr:cisplatin damage response ATP-dependent DNA ligase [Polymorphobacter fuscus]KAB7644843.1 cisplatin damage response ATP-dependent DNA ligase [Polymorphobacter fuscus]MQT18119.1 cisplatin damage response ATP-dependent DNA ligase [Polymorphobacter fuscus]NJC09437.1 DNA ligase-1 [Polymorphobacter fuscus]